MRLWVIAAWVVASASAGAARAADRPWTLHEALGAPPNLTLSGSIRFRYEALDGQVRPGFAPSEDFLAIRTILDAEYRTGPFRIGGTLYDSRVYGADRVTVLSTTDVNALEPIQAYVGGNFKGALGAGSTLDVQLGRMALNVGSRRLVASDDYRNTNNGYTGLKLEAKARAGLSATVIYVEPQLRLPDDLASLRRNRVKLDHESKNQVLWGAVVAKAIPGAGAVEAEYFGFDERDSAGRPTRNRNLHNFGARLIKAPAKGRLDWEFEGIRQVGTVRASTAAAAPILDVSAGFAHAELGYQFEGAWKPHLALEYDWVEGDHGGGKYNRFDTLFGFRRADFAPAGLYNDVARANLSMAALRLEVEPSARLDAMVHAGPMWLASRTDAFSTSGVRDASGRSGSYAGLQVESRLRYWIVPKSLRLELTGLWLDKGRFLREAPNAPRTGDTLYGAAALTVNY